MKVTPGLYSDRGLMTRLTAPHDNVSQIHIEMEWFVVRDN